MKDNYLTKPFKHSYLPDALAEDVDAEVVRYERILQENPVDLQLQNWK